MRILLGIDYFKIRVGGKIMLDIVLILKTILVVIIYIMCVIVFYNLIKYKESEKYNQLTKKILERNNFGDNE